MHTEQITVRKRTVSRAIKVSLLLTVAFFIFTLPAIAAPTTGVLGGGISINEVLPDPNGANNFDTDGNGTADTLDEFVEIYNLSGGAIDISGYELWDSGNGLWFTFPAGTTLGAGNYAMVIAAVQAGGALPTLDAGNLAFDAARTGGVVNNGGDNVVLYDPTADEFVQILYNNDTADDPVTGYAGFSATATLIGSVEDFGSDSDGVSLVREPAGDTNIVQHNSIAAENASPGAPSNADSGPSFDNLLINEVDADQTGTDNAEFVELYDGGAGNTPLDGLSIVLYNGSDDLSYLAFDLDGHSTGADGYFVLCGDSGNTANCDLDVTPDTNLIQNGEDAVALIIGDAADFPNDSALPADENIVDAIVYETGNDTDSALLALLNAGQGVVDEDGGVDKDIESNQRCANGSGGQRNSDTYTQAAPSPGAANSCGGGPVADIIINEVDADQTSTDNAEFVELYDGGVGNSDLSGLVLVLMNGSDDASYAAFDLDGQSTDANGYFVLCGDAANTANCDLDVSPDTNLIQNGADAVALYTGDAADFPNDTAVTTTNLLDAIVYDTNDGDDAGLLVLMNAGEPQVNEDDAGDKDGHSNQRCANGTGGARNTSTYAQFAPTPGEENICEIIVPPVSCEDDSVITFIHDVQGSGLTSPLLGTEVTIDGVVVGDFQNNASADNGDLNGFYVQEEDSEADADSSTSEGIFVFGISDVDVTVGDHVRVRGTVAEFTTSGGASSLTELSSASVDVCATPAAMPTATSVTLPLGSADDMESYEGMLVSFDQDLVIAEYFNFDRFNEIVLALPALGQDRPFQPTAVYEPGSVEAADLADLNARSRITLDDGRTGQNMDPAIHPDGNVFDLTNTFRGGDIVQGATGVIDDTFGVYRIQPTQGANYTAVNPRPATPADVGGTLTVASFNVLNYFTTLDDSGAICGPNGDLGCRGADNAEEFERQRIKIIAALIDIDADIVGLVELENNSSAAIADLVSGLNDIMGTGTYAYIDTGTIGTDAIKVGLIYKPATVTPYGAYQILDASVDARFDDSRNRPVLAQTFFENDGGGTLTVAVNHLKSKGSSCGTGDDDPEQGNCNLTRTLAAQALVDWLATDPTNSGDADYLIIGDLNAYDKEDPIDAILNGADDALGTGDDYHDLIHLFGGEFAYSYVFSGQFGYLDYGLANSSLLPQVTGVTDWHINADEPDLLNYDTTFKQDAQDALFEENAFRASDHDPVIIGLDLTSATNADGCWVLAIDGSPYTGPATIVQYNGASRFQAHIYARDNDLPRNTTCYEIHGTDASEIIYGENSGDTIYGYGGDDALYGRNGDDTLIGGAGADFMIGNGGFDTVLDYEPGIDFCGSVEDGC